MRCFSRSKGDTDRDYQRGVRAVAAEALVIGTELYATT
jgi:hypothetical protein